MIIGIDKGHSKLAGTPNFGASGYVVESTEVRVIGDLVIKHLKELGHTVIDCTVDKPTSNRQSLNQRVANANKQHLDIFVSIHLNAGGGHGTEIFTYGAKQTAEAKRVLDNIVALGFRNRGVKDGKGLAVVRRTKAPSMLVECFFVDSKEDTDRYDANKMAKAIAEGIVGQAINTSVDKPKGDDTQLTKNEVIKLVNEMLRPSENGEQSQHWADESFNSLMKKGIEIHDKKFADVVTRGELFAMLDRVVK